MRLGSTMIYVTHDQIEALTLADRIAVMHAGVIQQLASPKEIYTRPVNRYVAGFVGSPAMNFLEGTTVKVNGGVALKLADGQQIGLDGYPFTKAPEEGRPIALGVRPEQVDLKWTQRSASAIPITVTLIDPMGADSLLWGSVGTETVSVRIGADDQYRIGETLKAGFMPSAASIFDQQSGDRL
jgi:multiple sugar transport system ATP-binding protein